MKRKLMILAAAIALAVVGPTASAQTCDSSGLFANAACQLGIMDNGTAHTLDRLNAQTGQPFDHAVTRAMDSYVPGSGTAVEGYWAARAQHDRMQQQRQPRGEDYSVQPTTRSPDYGTPPYIIQERDFSEPYPMPRQNTGSVCVTSVGQLPLGPAPIGTPCWMGTPWGPVTGRIAY